MYKLLIVDDEYDVREGILREILWEKHGLEVVGTAENGKDAYDLVECLVPDIVIADIKMPYMDGLKLSELIKQKYPATKIIILTGFDEFEFAQKAVKLRIDEYILKPFSSQELLNVLLRMKSQIEEETAQKKDIQKLKEYYDKSFPILKANFLTLLLTRKLKESEILDKSAALNINLDGNGFIVSVIKIDSRLYEDTDLSLFAVLNIANEIFDKYNPGMAFLYDENIILISIYKDKESETAIADTLSILEEVRYCVEKYLQLSITIGVGTYCSDVSYISYSYKDAVLALDYRLILGSNRIIPISDLESRSARRAVFGELDERTLACCIKVGTADEIAKVVDSFFNELAEANVSYKDYQAYLLELLASILKIAQDSGIDLNDVLGTNSNVFAEVCGFGSLQEVRNWTLEVCTRIMERISCNRTDSCRNLVTAAKEYTKNHFHEHDITINKVCRHLHLSPGYFSTIFKRETKKTYLNYLIQMRMDAAKELLRTTEMKSFEIADRIGFSNANYFSNSFKKYFGISPTEYKNKSNM